MTSTTDSNDKDRWDAAFDAAREFIRRQCEADASVVDVGQVLDHLDKRFGKDAGLTSDVGKVLCLCVELWADPKIHQVADGWIGFFWDGSDRRLQGVSRGLRARLLGRSDAEELR